VTRGRSGAVSSPPHAARAFAAKNPPVRPGSCGFGPHSGRIAEFVAAQKPARSRFVGRKVLAAAARAGAARVVAGTMRPGRSLDRLEVDRGSGRNIRVARISGSRFLPAPALPGLDLLQETGAAVEGRRQGRVRRTAGSFRVGPVASCFQHHADQFNRPRARSRLVVVVPRAGPQVAPGHEAAASPNRGLTAANSTGVAPSAVID